jgi:hypothetical protein
VRHHTIDEGVEPLVRLDLEREGDARQEGCALHSRVEQHGRRRALMGPRMLGAPESVLEHQSEPKELFRLVR